jgi:hypothetical protein
MMSYVNNGEARYQNPDVAQYFNQKPETERVSVLIRAVEVEVFWLQRAEVGQSVSSSS